MLLLYGEQYFNTYKQQFTIAFNSTIILLTVPAFPINYYETTLYCDLVFKGYCIVKVIPKFMGDLINDELCTAPGSHIAIDVLSVQSQNVAEVRVY